jgi:hypothetical protein
MTERRCVVIAVRVSPREHERWRRAALIEGVRVVELVRESTRQFVRDVERLRLLGAEQRERAPLAAVSDVNGSIDGGSSTEPAP